MTDERLSLFRPGWVLRLAPAVLSVVMVFVLGGMHNPPIPESDFKWSDKVGHFFAFGFVQLTHVRALEFIFAPRKDQAQIYWSIGSATFVGAALEIWQAFLPHRSAEWADLFADGVGALLAGALFWVLFRRGEPS